MYWLKQKNFKYFVFNYGRDSESPDFFRAWSHSKGQKVFTAFDRVVEFKLYDYWFILEF